MSLSLWDMPTCRNKLFQISLTWEEDVLNFNVISQEINHMIVNIIIVFGTSCEFWDVSVKRKCNSCMSINSLRVFWFSVYYNERQQKRRQSLHLLLPSLPRFSFLFVLLVLLLVQLWQSPWSSWRHKPNIFLFCSEEGSGVWLTWVNCLFRQKNRKNFSIGQGDAQNFRNAADDQRLENFFCSQTSLFAPHATIMYVSFYLITDIV